MGDAERKHSLGKEKFWLAISVGWGSVISGIAQNRETAI